MASSLVTKRMLLLAFSAFNLTAAIVFGAMLAAGVVEPSRERLFLVGSLVVVSVVGLILSFIFKDEVKELQSQIDSSLYQRIERYVQDADDAPLPQNAPAASEPDPDDVPLPQNMPGGGR